MSVHPRIFVAIDDATTQDYVSRKALAVAEQNEAELIFGHVVNAASYEAPGTDYEKICAETRERIERDLSEVIESARSNPRIQSVEVVVRAGRLNDTLVDNLIKPCAPDLVICGERSMTNFKFAFVGSVSNNLIHNVECDILVVKNEANFARNKPE